VEGYGEGNEVVIMKMIIYKKTSVYDFLCMDSRIALRSTAIRLLSTGMDF
jgi:hypothetical protein